MSPELVPSATQFVVRVASPADAQRVQATVGALAQCEPVPGHPGLCLLKLKPTRGSARSAWRKLREKLGPDAALAPVLLDAEQHARYPTGQLMARFQRALPDEELAAMARALGLEVAGRNKFIGSQVAFRSVDSTEFLPELLERMQRAWPAAVKVWIDTLSQYRRE